MAEDNNVTLEFIAKQNAMLMNKMNTMQEYLELQFTMIRNRDNRLASVEAELQALETVINRHGKRIEQLEMQNDQ